MFLSKETRNANIPDRNETTRVSNPGTPILSRISFTLNHLEKDICQINFRLLKKKKKNYNLVNNKKENEYLVTSINLLGMDLNTCKHLLRSSTSSNSNLALSSLVKRFRFIVLVCRAKNKRITSSSDSRGLGLGM